MYMRTYHSHPLPFKGEATQVDVTDDPFSLREQNLANYTFCIPAPIRTFLIPTSNALPFGDILKQVAGLLDFTR